MIVLIAEVHDPKDLAYLKNLSDILAKIFPKLISLNKFGFVEGRVMGDCILLAQGLMKHVDDSVLDGNVSF